MLEPKYTVEYINRPFGGRVPWHLDSLVQIFDAPTKRDAIRIYRKLERLAHPEGNSSWAGHVRIVGRDGYVYTEQDGGGGEPKLIKLGDLKCQES